MLARPLRFALAVALVLVAACGSSDPPPQPKGFISGGYFPSGGAGISWPALNASANDRLGYDGTGSVAINPSYLSHHNDEWCENFTGNANSSIVWNNMACATASGACTVQGTSLRNGLVNLSTSSSSTGTTRVASALLSYSFHGTDATTAEFLGVAIPTLDDGTDKFDVYIGFGDITNADQTDGAYFLYHNTTGGGAGGVNSAKWQIATAANAVRLRATLDGSTTDTQDRTVAVGDDSVVAGTGTVYNLKITCTTARCDFYMQRLGTDTTYVRVGSACSSGCSMAETSIPPAVTTSASARAFGILAQITKWAGTTARVMYIDGVCLSRPLASGR